MRALVVLVMCAVSTIARSASVWGCTGGDDDALAGTPSCYSEGSTCPSAGLQSHETATLVSVCQGGGSCVEGGGGPSCGSESGKWVWRKVNDMHSGDLVYTGETQLTQPSELDYTSGGGGGGEEGGGDEVAAVLPTLSLTDAWEILNSWWPLLLIVSVGVSIRKFILESHL